VAAVADVLNWGDLGYYDPPQVFYNRDVARTGMAYEAWQPSQSSGQYGTTWTDALGGTTTSVVLPNHYGPVQLWDVASGKQRAVYGPKHWYPVSLAISPDGKAIALSGSVAHEEYGAITLLCTFQELTFVRLPA